MGRLRTTIKPTFHMKSSTLILGNLLILTASVLSAPLQYPDDQSLAPRQIGRLLAGFYGLVSAATIGVMGLGMVMRGLVRDWTNRKMVRHVFEELRRYDAEKVAGGRVGGFVPFDKTAGQPGNGMEISGEKSEEDKEDEM